MMAQAVPSIAQKVWSVAVGSVFMEIRIALAALDRRERALLVSQMPSVVMESVWLKARVVHIFAPTK